MAHLFKLDIVLPNAALTDRPSSRHIARLLGALAAEHAIALRAAGKAALPRRCLAELRAWYCPESSDSGRGASRDR